MERKSLNDVARKSYQQLYTLKKGSLPGRPHKEFTIAHACVRRTSKRKRYKNKEYSYVLKIITEQEAYYLLLCATSVVAPRLRRHAHRWRALKSVILPWCTPRPKWSVSHQVGGFSQRAVPAR